MISIFEEIICYSISFAFVLLALFTNSMTYTGIFATASLLFHPLLVNTVMLYAECYKYNQYIKDYRCNLLEQNNPVRTELTEFMIDYLNKKK
jgi:hypothetical protein